MEALHQLMNNNAVELVKNQESLGFYNWLFLVSKQQVETFTRSQQPEQIPQGGKQ